MDVAPGERILFRGHPSWRSILGFHLSGALLAAAAGALAAGVTRVLDHHVRWGVVLAVALAVMAATVLAGLVRRVSTTYAISDQRLSIRRGILTRTRQETRLDRVQNVNTRQSLLERVLRVGTVDFDTAGTESFDFAFRGVADPEGIATMVDRALRESGAG